MSQCIEEEFSAAAETIGWAWDDVAEVERLLIEYYRSDRIEYFFDFDEETKEHVHKARIKIQPPAILRRKSHDALMHARHSFDQVMFAARNLLDRPSNSGVNFPWARDPDDLPASRLSKVGIPEAIHDTIRQLKPYGVGANYDGGNDTIRSLAALANSKHKAGLTTIVHTGGAELRWEDMLLKPRMVKVA